MKLQSIYFIAIARPVAKFLPSMAELFLPCRILEFLATVLPTFLPDRAGGRSRLRLSVQGGQGQKHFRGVTIVPACSSIADMNTCWAVGNSADPITTNV